MNCPSETAMSISVYHRTSMDAAAESRQRQMRMRGPLRETGLIHERRDCVRCGGTPPWGSSCSSISSCARICGVACGRRSERWAHAGRAGDAQADGQTVCAPCAGCADGKQARRVPGRTCKNSSASTCPF
eukprot:scaffold98700_cov25-Tisochrysis_lutea.AAC.3